jgi:hypothetical protein
MHSQEADENLLTHIVVQAAISFEYPEFSFCSLECKYKFAIHNLTFTVGGSHAENTKLMYKGILFFIFHSQDYFLSHLWLPIQFPLKYLFRFVCF